MDNLLRQLSELAIACRRKKIKPIICGGLGVYLNFFRKEGEIRQMIRATRDIDLMFSRQDLLDEAKRLTMAEIITGELEYVVQDDKKHHGFRKDPDQELDILVPPVEGLPQENYRLKIVRSTLHGHLTPEAEFVDEDLRTIRLSDFSEDLSIGDDVVLYVPCPTNIMIMKLFAFQDRIQGDRKEPDRASAHAFDMYVTIMLTDRNDLKEGQQFVSRHEDSDIIQETKDVILDRFSNPAKEGWQAVLGSSGFYPTLSKAEREEKLRLAAARLVRWFGVEVE